MKHPFKSSQYNRRTPNPDLPTNQISASDQETSALDVISNPSPVTTPPQPDLLPDQISVADQETSALDIISSPSPVTTPPQSDLLPDQIFVSDQETSALDAVSDHSSMSIPLSLDPPTTQTLVTDQETISLTAITALQPATPQKPVGSLPALLRHMFSIGLARLQEPQPEGLLTRGLQVIKPGSGLGLVPLLALINASGLFVVSLSYYLSIWKYSYPIIEACFLGGLLLLFVPNLVRLLSRAPSRLERIHLIVVLAICCYFLQFMASPLHFSGFDESLHWRTVDDILRSGHLFSENAMLPVSPYYPGLEIVTSAISTTTGLDSFYAGNIVIAASHLLMVLALYLFYEHITNSSRMAGIIIVVYMTNPHFLFFDAAYSYETLALPLALLMMYILTRYRNGDQNHRWVIATAWIVLIAVTITHHMTNYVFDGYLLLWAGINFFQPVPRRTRIHLTAITLFALLLSLTYAFLFPGNPVWYYLSDYFGSTFNQLGQIITGNSAARPLFANSAQVAPVWDRLLITGSVALVTFSLPFGLLTIQRLHRDNALAITFGLASLAYPLTQTFRFTSFGTEITDRSAAFLFLPIAYTLTVLITHFWPTRRLSRKTISYITAAILTILLGNVIVAKGPNLTGIPGPYLVVADARSVEPEGIEAAMWSLAYLGPDNRIATDRIGQMLMSTYGHQRIVTRIDDGIDVAPIFYSAQFDSADINILQTGKIHFLVVDTRISTALPLEDTYFENDVPHSVISGDALTKFTAVTQINRLFDSGDLVIYDTGAFINGSSP